MRAIVERPLGAARKPHCSLETLYFMFTDFMATQSNSSSFSMEDFAKALDQETFSSQRGDMVQGKIVEHTREGAYVDIGGKAAAFLPLQEASLRAVLDLSATLPVGETFTFLVIRDQNADGQVTLSIRQWLLRQAWDKLAEMKEANATLEVKVNGVNRGGVTADVEGLKAFIPRSQLNEKEDLDSLKGKILRVKFLELNRETKKVVLSERMAEQSIRIAQLEVGQLVQGQVTGIRPFGAFVSFEGSTGLLHVAQMSEKRVQAVESVLEVGQAIAALIVDIDEGRGRISLSTKVLENYAGEVIENLAEVVASAESRAERARAKLDQGQGAGS